MWRRELVRCGEEGAGEMCVKGGGEMCVEKGAGEMWGGSW